MKTHQFRNGSKIEISFPIEETDSEESDDESDEQELEQPPGKAVLSMYGDTGTASFDMTDPLFVVTEVAHYIYGLALIQIFSNFWCLGIIHMISSHRCSQHYILVSEPIAEPVRPGSAGTKQQRNAALSNITTEHETLLVYNLLDVDEETLYYWVKSVTGVWPASIHLSESEEKAIVKIPLVDQGLGTCFQGFHGFIVVKDD